VGGRGVVGDGAGGLLLRKPLVTFLKSSNRIRRWQNPYAARALSCGQQSPGSGAISAV
jgi:hypothetical protein